MPPVLVSMIRTLFPIAPYGRSSLSHRRHASTFLRSIRKGEEPVLVQTFSPEPTIECEKGSGGSLGDCCPRHKMKALSMGLPSQEKSSTIPRW